MRTLVVALAMTLAGASLRAQTPVSPPVVAPENAVTTIASVALVNAGFESTQPGLLGAPVGWWLVQHAGPMSYRFTLDTTNPRSGERSLKVENIGPEPVGTIFQTVRATPHRGRTLRFAAWVRTEGAAGNRYGSGAGLNLQAMRGGYPIAYVMMRTDAIKGTTDWARYEVALKVPIEAEVIEMGPKKMNSRAYCTVFNFKGTDQQKLVGALSGGERNRVHLAKLLKQGGNLLLLDEPTNDLDVDTLRSLEDAIENFAGCVVVISHDRWFLDRIATHILAFEGESKVVWFEGNYQDYEADKKKRLGDVGPTRLKYKPLPR